MNSCISPLSLPPPPSYFKLFYLFISAHIDVSTGTSCCRLSKGVRSKTLRLSPNAALPCTRPAALHPQALVWHHPAPQSPLLCFLPPQGALLQPIAVTSSTLTTLMYEFLSTCRVTTRAVCRRQVSPMKSQVSFFTDPPAKEPVEVSASVVALALHLSICSTGHHASDFKM